MTITIGGQRIGERERPYVIAELSANHGGDLQRAKRIIEIAAAAGANAIKFQAYQADDLTLDCPLPDFRVNADNPWKGRRLHELYSSAATPYEWFPELFETARSLGLTPFASVFGPDAVELLERLEAPAYKIASFEAVDLDLIAACAQTGKPVIISTGLCNQNEIAEALEAALSNGTGEVALLKCSSAYPAKIEETNLLAIPRMREVFGVPIGYSDHTLGATASIAAVALGACIIEKHVIDSRDPPTADSDFSALPDELEELVRGCHQAFLARGEGRIEPSPHEQKSVVFRRSLYAYRDISAGAPLDRDNVRSVRPGYGLAPKHLQDVIGRRAARDIRRGEPLSWDILE